MPYEPACESFGGRSGLVNSSVPFFFWVWFVNVFADEGTGSGPSKFWLHFATKLCCSGLFLVQLGASMIPSGQSSVA
jgi:hypothetical protein